MDNQIGLIVMMVGITIAVSIVALVVVKNTK